MTATETEAEEQLTRLRGLVTTATQKLLGDTITVADEDWRTPSRLPGWTRGHVATHLARQADALGRLVGWAHSGERAEMYTNPEQRESEIEDGAGRPALDLQIDLDTTAGRLEEGFDSLDEAAAWDTVVELRGGIQMPARLLPLARLLEVIIHHVDLDIGYEIADVEAPTAEWLLEWSAFRLRGRDEFPRLDLQSTSGSTITIGSSGTPRTVRGTSAALLGWLFNRTDGAELDGDDGLVLPAF